MATPDIDDCVDVAYGRVYAEFVYWKINQTEINCGNRENGEYICVVSTSNSYPECLKSTNQNFTLKEIGVSLLDDCFFARNYFGVFELADKRMVTIDVTDISKVFNDSDGCDSAVYTKQVNNFRTAFDAEWEIIRKHNQFLKNVLIYHYDGNESELENLIQSCCDKPKQPGQQADYEVDSEEVDGTNMDPVTSSFPLDGIGIGLAWFYFNSYLKIVLKYLQANVSHDQFSHLLQGMAVICSNDETILESSKNDFSFAGIVGTHFNKGLDDKECFQIDIFSIGIVESKEVMHCFVDYPKPLLMLKALQNKGKLSDRQYNHEFGLFYTTLSDILNKNTDYKKLLMIISDDDILDNLPSCIWRHFSANSNHTKDKNNIENGISNTESEVALDDLETDGPVSEYVGEEDEYFSDSIAIVAISVQHGYEDYWTLRDVIDLHPDSGDVVDNIPLTTNMVIASAKQGGIINEKTYSTLISDSKLSVRQRASYVVGLVLFCAITSLPFYESLKNSVKGMLRRAGAQKITASNCEPGEMNENAGDVMYSKKSVVTSHEKSSSTKKKEKNTTKKSEENSVLKIESSDQNKRRVQIIQDILFNMIEDKKFLLYDFEIQLRKLALEYKCDVTKLRNKEGLSLLHSMVINNRQQFILPLFRLGCWKDIYTLKVEEGKGSEHAERTADELCGFLRFRKVQKEIDTFAVWEKSLNLVHISARKGDLAEVKRILQYSEDLHNELDSNDCNSLYWAVVGGNLEIVKLLLNLKVDHVRVNTRKETILHVACMLGHCHLLELLVSDLKLDLTVKDMAKKSALLRISENGDEKSLVKLMECGLETKFLGPLLAIAGHYGRLSFIKKVVEVYGIDPQSKDDAGKSALLRASDQGRIEVLKYLFTKDIDVREADVRKRNVLHVAADGANKDVIEFLLIEIKKKVGAELKSLVNTKDKYIGGELCMLIRGKDKGRDSWHYVEVSRGLMDIFMKRTRGGTIDVAKYGTLLHSGWGVDPDDESARDIEKRFEARRNATSADDLDMTPLHIAAFKDKTEVAELLLENGADPNIRDKFGMTPLHITAMRGNIELAKLLLKKGAMTDMLDNLVKTPADVAKDNEHEEMSNYLKGDKYQPIAQNFRDVVIPNTLDLLSEERIQTILESGTDLRTHLINTLRDLTVDINESLLKLGSGPVLEETSDKQ